MLVTSANFNYINFIYIVYIRFYYNNNNEFWSSILDFMCGNNIKY